MKGEREVVEHILVQFRVVLVHRLKEGLFIADDEVVDEVIVDFQLLLDLSHRGLG